VKRAITITGWQRPQLFHALLKSLAANDLRGWQIFVQLEPSEYVEVYRAAAAEVLADVPVFVTANPERLGIRMNPYSLLSRVFEGKADFVLYLEEDLLLAPDATALAQWYASNHRSGRLQSLPDSLHQPRAYREDAGERRVRGGPRSGPDGESAGVAGRLHAKLPGSRHLGLRLPITKETGKPRGNRPSLQVGHRG
jgi:hypothetical protein